MKPIGAEQVRRHLESNRRIAENLRLQSNAALQHAQEATDEAARKLWKEVADADLKAAAAIEKSCDDLLRKHDLHDW